MIFENRLQPICRESFSLQNKKKIMGKLFDLKEEYLFKHDKNQKNSNFKGF